MLLLTTTAKIIQLFKFTIQRNLIERDGDSWVWKHSMLYGEANVWAPIVT